MIVDSYSLCRESASLHLVLVSLVILRHLVCSATTYKVSRDDGDVVVVVVVVMVMVVMETMW